MIILDTNVISEIMRAAPAPAVIAWIDRTPRRAFHLTTISLAELRLGAALLPLGRRKDEIMSAVTQRTTFLFQDRLLNFDRAAALAYADVVADARRQGRAIAMADGQIAAIARVHACSIATRDTKPFVAAGIPVINPWLDA